MHRIRIIFTAVFNLFFLFSQAQNYQYTTNLEQIESDEIVVELNCPPITSNEIIYYFPKTVPGTYAELNYGKYIKKFSAYDGSGNKLKTKKHGINAFLITNAKSLKTITYKVEDTFDKKIKKKKKIFEPAGTGFEKGKYFLFNNGGLFGCFEGMENLPFLLDITKQEGIEGFTSLKGSSEKNKAHFEASNYHQLIDCPILFTYQKMEQLQVGNCTITIANYSKNDSTSYFIKKEIEPLFEAIQKFTGTLPVNNYNLLIFIEDQQEIGKILATGKVKLFQIPKMIKTFSKGYGALEHGTSSVYFLPDFGDNDFSTMLKEVISHEFMHIYTPLNLHSDLIGNFDYLNPKMSKHLWLYEGITEYFSFLIRLQGSLINIDVEAKKELRWKIISSQRYPDSIPFTKMSANVFDKPYKDLYPHVYDRGALIAMLLDFEIMRLTGGDKTLKTVVFELSKKYGQSNSFNENDFITEFVSSVHPELQQFFDNYIMGTKPLDIKAGFNVIGIDYSEKLETIVPINVVSVKDNGVKLSMFGIMSRWEVKKVGENDIVGFKKGDKVDKRDARNCFENEKGQFVPEGTIISLPVLRDEKEITLSFPAKYKEGVRYHTMNVNPDATPLQKKLYTIWTKGK